MGEAGVEIGVVILELIRCAGSVWDKLVFHIYFVWEL
jgi:hypothetical protein